MSATVQADSRLVTSHYRLALADYTELVSIFSATPATLQIATRQSISGWCGNC